MLVVSRRPPARSRGFVAATAHRLGDRESRAAAAALVLAWNVAGEVSASQRHQHLLAEPARATSRRPPTWIDDATGGKPTIYLGQKITDPQGIWLMEFWNRGAARTSGASTAPRPPPGRQAPGFVTPDAGPDGRLTGKSIPTGAPPGVDYMVADEDIEVAGQGDRAPAGAIA